MAEETHEERVNRELIELLNELRVALPGVQVLFAFLLAVPFSQRFAETTELQRDAYMAALLEHARRLGLPDRAVRVPPDPLPRPRQGGAARISNVFAIIGIVFLALAMTAVVFLVTDLIFKGVNDDDRHGRDGALFATVWFVLPLVRKAS